MTLTPETIVQTIENGIYGKPKLEIASNVGSISSLPILHYGLSVTDCRETSHTRVHL